MLERLRRTLVESLIGAIALGCLLAIDILRFVDVFGSPAEASVTRSEFPHILRAGHASSGFPFNYALLQLACFLLLLLVWYLMFRWLYFKPFKKGISEPVPSEN